MQSFLKSVGWVRVVLLGVLAGTVAAHQFFGLSLNIASATEATYWAVFLGASILCGTALAVVSFYVWQYFSTLRALKRIRVNLSAAVAQASEPDSEQTGG